MTKDQNRSVVTSWEVVCKSTGNSYHCSRPQRTGPPTESVTVVRMVDAAWTAPAVSLSLQPTLQCQRALLAYHSLCVGMQESRPLLARVN